MRISVATLIALIAMSGLGLGVVFADDFNNIPGYEIVADVLDTVPINKMDHCANFCQRNASKCIGFEFDGKICKIFARIRNIRENATVLTHFVLQRSNDDKLGMDKKYNKIEVATVANAIIDSSNGCPDGFTVYNSKCYRNIPEPMCREYSPLLKVSIENGVCVTEKRVKIEPSAVYTLR